MKIKKIALMLVMVLSINIVGSSCVFASSSNNSTLVTSAVESQTRAITNEAITNTINAQVEDGTIQPNSVPSAAVKAAAKWLKDNYDKVLNKIPTKYQKYFEFDAFTKVIDAYVGFSDTINELLTNVVSYLLPDFAQAAVPGIVAILELILPF
ncbi:hypothetical protein [Desulfosporosinus shakirovi]|uniref:hypothetical protein n=1 Tax=Desulfosporosinus shakirovi TaxID=2885154 RepID=UPI001E5DC12E|nr:hypothetical protein [Desulfosporosinus sp. SRJS8]MCB8815352.1 hypothetical protein [Desulfosporosinus sp. SRJS8]